MGTLVEEIIGRKIGQKVAPGEIHLVELDYMMTHDNTTPLAIKAFREIAKPIRDKSKIVIHFDHAYPSPSLAAASAQKGIIDFMKEQEIENFFHQGICHQVMIEEGFVTPGSIIIGGDSHTNTLGALGCLGIGFGSSEIGAAWITGCTWLRVPETIRINITGKLSRFVSAKDVILHIIGKLSSNGARGKCVEFGGSLIRDLPIHERIVFPNMSTELGAKCGLIETDEALEQFLTNETRASGPFETFVAVNPEYEQVIEIDASRLEPQIACHPKVDHVVPVSEVTHLPIDQVFIGTCTNGRFEDLQIAAELLRGRQVNRFTRTIITPASKNIYQRAINEGLIKTFLDAGCDIGIPGCGACIGRHGGLLGPGERALTTMNRNFTGRMGSPEAEIYLASPAVAAATAIVGKIADPRDIDTNQGA